jgi:hypothetical protein
MKDNHLYVIHTNDVYYCPMALLELMLKEDYTV